MAVGFFNDRMAQLGLDHRATSVGLWREGEPATRHGVAVMAEYGIDTSEHRSRILDVGHIRDADLIVGLAREHVREAAVRDAEALSRSFTLKELVRLAEAPGGVRLEGVGESVRAWAMRISGARSSEDLLGAHPEDDVADPIGRSRGAYERTAAEIGEHVERLVRVLHPSAVHPKARA